MMICKLFCKNEAQKHKKHISNSAMTNNADSVTSGHFRIVRNVSIYPMLNKISTFKSSTFFQLSGVFPAHPAGTFI